MTNHDRAVDALRALGAQFSPDFDAYAAGELDAAEVRCVLCGYAPCVCTEAERLAATEGPKCEACHQPIEFVPTPPECSPVHTPPYWRHRGLIGDPPHAALPPRPSV